MIEKTLLTKNRLLHNAIALLLLGCLAGFYILPVSSQLGRDIIYTSSALLIVAGLFGFSSFSNPLQNKPLILALLAFSVTCLFWYYLFRQPGEFHGIYTQYQRLGRALMVSALLVLIVSNYQIHLPDRLIKTIFIGGGLIINLVVIYQGYAIEFSRVSLDLMAATSAAYIFTIFDILMFQAVLTLKTRWRHSLLMVTFFIGYCAIIFTGTRAAMICYPIVTIVLLASTNPRSRKRVWLLTAIITILSLSAMLFYKPLVTARMADLKADVTLLSNNDSYSSVGSRAAMLLAGLQSGIAAPLGQSSEQRAHFIRGLIEETPMLSGAAISLDSHMHNEIIEAFSQRGVIGVVIVLWVYCALLLTALRKERFNLSLLLITLCMIFYGISDVIFFGWEVYLAYLVAVVVSIALNPVQILASGSPPGSSVTLATN